MQELHAIVCLLFINYASSELASDCNVEGCPECKLDGTCNVTCNNGYTGLSCDKCESGHHLDGKMCKQCLKECISCTSDYECYQCIDGRWGKYCQRSCSNNCRQNKCDKGTGKCTEGCIANRYGDECGGNCSIGCDGQCNQHDGTCRKCKDGYTGLSCKNCDDGYYLYGRTCRICLKECISCTSDYECYQCIDGRWGKYCQWSCSNNCRQNKCEKGTGKCTEGCIANRYGDDCGDTCSIGCDGQCNQHDGTCTCKDGYTGTTCENCGGGYYRYGRTCRICLKECISCTSDYECNECIDGRYGQYCQYPCSNYCRQNNCDKGTGKCTEGCTANRYGDECGGTCSIGCEGQCNQHDGTCTCNDGFTGTTCSPCKNGYSGDKCCVQSKGCRQCSTDSECFTCTSGFYGTKCEQICPIHCNDGCNKETGQCTSCKDGYFGSSCNITCSVNCLACAQNGSCTSCKEGFYGDACDYTCSENCKNCFDEKYCSSCKDGYYGTTCNTSCPVNCFACAQDGTCSSCKEGFYGDKCGFQDDQVDSASVPVYVVVVVGVPLVFVIGILAVVLYFALRKLKETRQSTQPPSSSIVAKHESTEESPSPQHASVPLVMMASNDESGYNFNGQYEEVDDSTRHQNQSEPVYLPMDNTNNQYEQLLNIQPEQSPSEYQALALDTISKDNNSGDKEPSNDGYDDVMSTKC